MKTEASPALRRPVAVRPPALCSRVTNGKSLFAAGGDMRGPWARRLRDLFELHLSDLGGPDNVSEAERSIIRRASVLTVELERIEARFAVGKGSDDDLDLYQRTAGNLRRLLESVGLQRRMRPVQTLGEYMAARDTEETSSSALECERSALLLTAAEKRASAHPCGEEGPSP